MTLRVPSLLGEPQWKIRCGHRLEPTIASAQLLMQFMVPLKMWRLAKLRLLLWVTPTTASGGAKTNAHQAIVVTPALKIPKHRGEFIAKVGGAVSIPTHACDNIKGVYYPAWCNGGRCWGAYTSA